MTNGDAPATKGDIERIARSIDSLVQKVEHLDQKVQHIDQKVQHIDQKVEHLDQKVEHLDQKLDQSVAQLRSEASHNYNDLLERITDSETRVLKTIYDLTEAFQKRADHLEDSDSAMIKRMSSLEARVIELEKRLNMPPSN